ncbi:melanopsin-like [Montipora foliosa]|uniref:melanopsin-like n=1 Tax=Montipora foliosa TaxID=591990 RepID=UPI0035F19585
MTNVTSQDLFSSNETTVSSNAEVWLSVAFLCIVDCGMIAGNLLVLTVVWRTLHLHEPNYFFLCSLSVADLLVGMIYCPLLIVSAIKQSWPFGDAVCHFHAVVICISLNASLLNLCVISIDRYLYITRPLRYPEIVTTKKTILTIVFLWFHSIFWAIAPLFGWGEYTYEESTATCKPNWSGQGQTNRTYALGLALFCFLFPVLVMVGAYTMIFIAARKQLQNVAAIGGEMTKSHKAAKTVFLIIGLFFFCWSVYTVVSLWKLFASVSDLPARLVRIGLYLAVSNSCVNFYVYAIRDKVFQKGLLRILVPRRRYKADNWNRSNPPSTLELDFTVEGCRSK